MIALARLAGRAALTRSGARAAFRSAVRNAGRIVKRPITRYRTLQDETPAIRRPDFSSREGGVRFGDIFPTAPSRVRTRSSAVERNVDPLTESLLQEGMTINRRLPVRRGAIHKPAHRPAQSIISPEDAGYVKFGESNPSMKSPESNPSMMTPESGSRSMLREMAPWLALGAAQPVIERVFSPFMTSEDTRRQARLQVGYVRQPNPNFYAPSYQAPSYLNIPV